MAKSKQVSDWYSKSISVDRRKSREMFLDFEAGLAKAVLKSEPMNLDALIMLGNSLTRMGKDKDALEVDKKVVRILPKNPVAYYNLACSYSNLGKLDEAFSSLEMALRLGYKEFGFILRDRDLRNLRNDPRFSKLLTQYRKRSSRSR